MVLLTKGASASSPAFNFARSADLSTFPKVSRMKQHADGGWSQGDFITAYHGIHR